MAAGSENRDYETLIEAARVLPGVDFLVAAGSHWARRTATPGIAPPPDNVEFLREPLDFAALRDCYARATAIVVPLFDVENQSGVTTILEAMSMGRAVVVSATRGQQECVAGPLVEASGACNVPATASRGPLHFFGEAASGTWTGVYVPPGDARALAAALGMLSTGNHTFDSERIRKVAATYFDTSAFTRRLVSELVSS
ncbi:MAG: glycosyltransferase [Dehalococcoidia bacterium]|nr:glycosyltransferase [Dehalococcoidia bacterium]